MINYIKEYNSKYDLLVAHEIFQDRVIKLGLTEPNYENLIHKIGVIILKRDIYLRDTNTYFKNMYKLYYDNDEKYLLIVRALIKPYVEILGNQNIIGVMAGSITKLTQEQKELRDKLDKFFIEMLYNQIPELIGCGLPIIFCDTSVKSKKREHSASTYYLL